MTKCSSELRPPDVYVRETGTPKGRGAYAARAFSAGELAEACPIIQFSGSFSWFAGMGLTPWGD